MISLDSIPFNNTFSSCISLIGHNIVYHSKQVSIYSPRNALLTYPLGTVLCLTLRTTCSTPPVLPRTQDSTMNFIMSVDRERVLLQEAVVVVEASRVFVEENPDYHLSTPPQHFPPCPQVFNGTGRPLYSI